MKPVLVVGIPRSGTTWVARVVALGTHARYLEEPDNHFRFGFAFRAKSALGQREYPRLEPGEAPAAARNYARLWVNALEKPCPGHPAGIRGRIADGLVARAGPAKVSAAVAGGVTGYGLDTARRLAVPLRPKAGEGPLIVKSVYAALSVEWIASRHDVEVVVTTRHPLNIVSSWHELGWLDEPFAEPLSTLDPAMLRSLSARFGAPPPPGGSPVGRATWFVGVLGRALDDAVTRNPSWHRLVHEDLCRSPGEGFHRLAATLGLPWHAAGDRAIDDWNRPGEGYETHRVAAELADAWESRLSPRDVEDATAVLDALSGSVR